MNLRNFIITQVDSLSVPTGTDDTLHTPHVFPHIIEDSTSNSSSAYKSVATSFISSTSVITENGRKKPRYRAARFMLLCCE
jgi:hypothetical protein